MVYTKHRMGITRWLAYSLVVSLLSVTLAGCSSATTAPQEVWGRSDAKEVDVNSKIPGRVINMLVKEGDTVTKGQVLARIDNRDIVAQANQARAGIKALESQTEQATTATEIQDQTAQATLDMTKAQLDKAATDLTLAENDYKRFSKLAASGSISRQLFETYEAKYKSAQSGYSQAESSVARAQSGLLQTDINRSGEAAAQSKLQQSQGVLQQVEVALDETEIKAPFSGIITAKYVEEGAMVSAGMPLVAIQDPTDNWINLKIKETELSNYQLQQTIQLEGRDSNLKVQGTIVDISKKPEFATYRSTNERSDNDIITFNVKIQINSDQLRPGMRFKVIAGEH
jgi:HlyD family secretion protein